MAFQIEWTEPALYDITLIVNYLRDEWNDDIAEKFIDTTERRLKLMASQPLIGKIAVKNASVRSVSLSKHNKLYYRVRDEKLIVLNIFDTRQNPSKNRFE